MGVLTLKLLVYGQLIWFILANNITHPDQTTESPSWLNNTSQMKPTLMAPPLNGTGNYTENNASNSSSNSMYNTSDATLTNLTTQVTTTGPQNTTLGPIHSNATVTGTTVQPNTTANAQTNSTQLTSKPKTTVNITSTAVTSIDIITHSSNESTTLKTSPVPIPTENAPTTVIQNNTTLFHESQGAGMNHSEKSMTILFSILLGVIVLIILVHFVYKSGRSNQSRIQYTHRRLQNEDTGEPFTVPEDTLVISGGLYDGPHIYNHTMTVQNEDEFQTDTTGLAYRPNQFHLELLVEDQGSALDRDTLTFQTFQANDQEP